RHRRQCGRRPVRTGRQRDSPLHPDAGPAPAGPDRPHAGRADRPEGRRRHGRGRGAGDGGGFLALLSGPGGFPRDAGPGRAAGAPGLPGPDAVRGQGAGGP
ncbi:hypothetical protein LTR94_036145, partial [Friedmanniomyces endolithicus]